MKLATSIYRQSGHAENVLMSEVKGQGHDQTNYPTMEKANISMVWHWRSDVLQMSLWFTIKLLVLYVINNKSM